jgi:biopolymer transport protein ExbD
MGRRKGHSSGEDVTLNMAAMLDMAFQLLTFFILTFRPSPVEGQISMRLPPPQAIVSKTNATKASSDTTRKDLVPGVTTLVINVYANPAGHVDGFQVGDDMVPGWGPLQGRLETVFKDPTNPFEQVILQVDENLRYEDLMKLVAICSEQVMPDGTRLSKLSFVELPRQ